ncbi:MAG: type II toxin-antitoxin system YafQ family toxin [Holophagaceae bacterium]|nr:type II toxin-antitoxin system YafQ family toxin [Holophagaceae bacterium]
MRAIETTTKFRRDFKRIQHEPDSDMVYKLVELLANDRQLPDTAHDHALAGTLRGYRECHIKPDLLSIYKKPDNQTLRLARVGSHSLLFG